MEIASHHSKKIVTPNDIVVEYIDYPNPYDFKKMHRHTYFEFLLFEKGQGGKQIIDFKEYEVVSKSIYLVLPGQVHLMKRLPKENGILVQFSKSALIQSIAPYRIDYSLQFSSITELNLSDQQFQRLYPLFKQLKKVYQSNSLLSSYKLLQLLGLALLELLEIVALQKDLSPPNNCAYQFLNAVETHFRKIQTVKEYSRVLNTPINKLNAKVKNHLGKSPLQIIHEVLLMEIKRLMIVEQLSHKEIAYELNFDSQSSYSRFIKKQTALSPSQLKEQLRQIAP